MKFNEIRCSETLKIVVPCSKSLFHELETAVLALELDAPRSDFNETQCNPLKLYEIQCNSML